MPTYTDLFDLLATQIEIRNGAAEVTIGETRWLRTTERSSGELRLVARSFETTADEWDAAEKPRCHVVSNLSEMSTKLSAIRVARRVRSRIPQGAVLESSVVGSGTSFRGVVSVVDSLTGRCQVRDVFEVINDIDVERHEFERFMLATTARLAMRIVPSGDGS